MKVVFVSNYFNHHQKPFSDAMDKLTNGQYRFIATAIISQERKKLGWGMECFPDYVVQNFISPAARDYAQELIDEADVVIIGSAPDELVKNRLKKKQLTFRYSERLYKKKCEWYKYPFRLVKHYFRFGRYKNLYMLCASAYTAADYAKTFCFKDKCYKWGYFPAFNQYDLMEKVIESKKENSIVWVARFIDWKHPEIPVKVAKILKNEGYDFEINLIGNGVLEEKIKSFIKEQGVEDCVNVLGSMKPEQVREYMEQSEIMLFTSDRNEGWGAVLNEGMNSGCAVVASHAIGSVPFLVEDKKNGLIYKDGDLQDLVEKVKWLLENPDDRKKIAKSAYETIKEQWNAENAAKRFLVLAEDLLKGDKASPFENGVCSKAEKLKDNWYR